MDPRLPFRTQFRLPNSTMTTRDVPGQDGWTIHVGSSMRGRKGISAADVVRACVSLKKQRRKLGPTNVRLELGKGSYRTIVRHLRLLAIREVGNQAGKSRLPP